ncbi:hypothetical protein FACS189419_01820 [Planctomycetales bacterium]|nr:hypothetical protein FACS189419_01820 [Planctomycetales bacterium]
MPEKSLEMIYCVCYLLAFLFEIAKITAMRQKIYTVLPAAVAAAGFILHSSVLYQGHIITRLGRSCINPISPAEMFFLVTAWGLILMYLYWSLVRPKIPFGLILLPLAVTFIFAGFLLHSEQTTSAVQESPPFLKMLHTVMLFLTFFSITLGSAGGLLYFLQDYMLQKHFIKNTVKLPTLEWSVAVCRESVHASAVFLGIGVLTGIYLSAGQHTAILWYDPLILGSLVLFPFLCVFAALSLSNFGKSKGRFIAAATVIVFLFLSAVLGFGIAAGIAHW